MFTIEAASTIFDDLGIDYSIVKDSVISRWKYGTKSFIITVVDDGYEFCFVDWKSSPHSPPKLNGSELWESQDVSEMKDVISGWLNSGKKKV